MGWYYVIEGNKRVSVMKSMNAEDIEADVTRVIPEKSDTPEYAAYMEYCDFSKETGLYHIFFTHPGSYQKLKSLPGLQQEDGAWNMEETPTLRMLYHYFHTAYRSIVHEKENSQPVGDAFLSYLVAFGYRTLRDEDQE
jgi:hypothetical protein